MTISEQTPINSYIGDGIQNTFSFLFRILDNTDLIVTVDAVFQVESVDYTIQNLTESGGDVVFEAGSIPGVGLEVKLERSTPKDQTTDYDPFDPFPAETHELALDKLTMLMQEVQVGSGAAFDPNANYATTGNWSNAGNWSFIGNLTFNGFQVATVNQIPDIANFTQNAVAEVITASWNFGNGITLNASLWPSDQGNPNQILKTDGTGALAWIDQAGGSGFDPTADYTVTGIWEATGPWTFSNANVFFEGLGLNIANSTIIRSRNVADSGSIDLVQVGPDDLIRFGSLAGFALGVVWDAPAATFHSIRIGATEVVRAVTRALGSFLIHTMSGAERKVGFRNPGHTRDLTSDDTFVQADEGQAVTCSGAGLFNIDVPVLEEGTSITLKNFCVGSVTLTGVGVTQTAYLGGIKLVGDLTIEPDSIVQFHWRSTIIVDVWGNGIS